MLISDIALPQLEVPSPLFWERVSRTGDRSSGWGRLRHVSSAEIHNGGPLTGPGAARSGPRAASRAGGGSGAVRRGPRPAKGAALGEPCPRPRRVDAGRTRQRILRAAAEVFTERGLQATLDDVAERAGVGVGTVYRRFPDKEALVEALFTERLDTLVGFAERALAEPDPWVGL